MSFAVIIASTQITLMRIKMAITTKINPASQIALNKLTSKITQFITEQALTTARIPRRIPQKLNQRHYPLLRKIAKANDRPNRHQGKATLNPD